MALDDRQKQIQTSAGLDESRLNQEFVDLLKRFSTPLLLVILVVVGGYVGWGKLGEARENKLGDAFSQYEAALKAGNPNNLLRVAEDFSGQREIGSLARMAAADIYLSSAIKGLIPGAELTPEGTTKNPDDILTAEKRTALLTDAKKQYQIVLDATRNDNFKAIHSLGALFGLAAVAETAGNAEEAKKYYAEVQPIADAAGLTSFTDMAKARAADVDKFIGGVRLLAAADVKSKPAPPAPAPAPIAPPTPELNFPPTPLDPEAK